MPSPVDGTLFLFLARVQRLMAPESLPPAMKASTVFESAVEAEDGCETPRPGSRASAKSTEYP